MMSLAYWWSIPIIDIVIFVVLQLLQHASCYNDDPLISQAIISIDSPGHHAVYEPHALIPIKVSIAFEAANDRAYNASSGLLSFYAEVDKVEVPPLQLNVFTSSNLNDAIIRKWATHRGLSQRNQAYLIARIQDSLEQIYCPLPSSCLGHEEAGGGDLKREICLKLDDQDEECTELDLYSSPTIRAPGLFTKSNDPLQRQQQQHSLYVRLKGFPGRHLLHQASSTFFVQKGGHPSSCHDSMVVQIVSPRHGEQVTVDSTGQVEIVAALVKGNEKSGAIGCARLDQQDEGEEGVRVECKPVENGVMRHVWSGLKVGSRYKLTVWREQEQQVADMGSAAGGGGVVGDVTILQCPQSISFETVYDDNEAAVGGGDLPLVFVTAASQLYYDEQRLQNLVGSIHFWEPDAMIEIYSLALSNEAMEEMKHWARVTIHQLDLDSLPPHIADWQQYAFKPIILQEALSLHENIFWIDANIELRRPLNEVRRLMSQTGYFFAEQPVRFPTSQYHHPHAVANLGCHVPDFSRQHCSTAFIGLRRNDEWVMKKLITPLVQCALNQTCINPPGASRANHRQEQTIVNSIMCSLNVTICQPGMRWRLSSDFENDHSFLMPTLDEQDFNDLVFYTRRNFPPKPYVNHLLRHSRM